MHYEQKQTKEVQSSSALKLEERFPTSAINGEILFFLPTASLLAFSRTTGSAEELVTRSGVWWKKIKNEFKRDVKNLVPESCRPLLLPEKCIHQHLKILSKLENSLQNRYTLADPALCQKSLTGEITEFLFLQDYFRKAVSVGNLTLVQWLMAVERGAQRVDPDPSDLYFAAGSGNLALVQWLMAEERGEQRLDPDEDVLSSAAASGNLALVQWLMAEERGEQRVDPGLLTLGEAAKSGNLALVQWLMAEERGAQRVSPGESDLHFAARSGNPALVKWLMAEERGEQRVNPNQATLNEAARSGNLALLKWLMAVKRGEQRVNPNQATLNEAARSGNLTLVKWLMAAKRGERRVNPNQATLDEAAKSGNLALVKWLTAVRRGAQRVNLDQSLLRNVAMGSGNLELMQWLMEDQRFSPDQDTLNEAARSGNLALVQWLMAAERGKQHVNPSRQTLNLAARSANIDLLVWLMAANRGQQRVNPGEDTLGFAVGNLPLMHWLTAIKEEAQRVEPSQNTLSVKDFDSSAVGEGSPSAVQPRRAGSWDFESIPKAEEPAPRRSLVLLETKGVSAKSMDYSSDRSETKTAIPPLTSNQEAASHGLVKKVSTPLSRSNSISAVSFFSVVALTGSPIHAARQQPSDAATIVLSQIGEPNTPMSDNSDNEEVNASKLRKR